MVLSLPVASTEKEVGSIPRIFSMFGLTPLRYSRLKNDFVIVRALYRLMSVSVSNVMMDDEMALDCLIRSIGGVLEADLMAVVSSIPDLFIVKP